jgi:hypothetical protein
MRNIFRKYGLVAFLTSMLIGYLLGTLFSDVPMSAEFAETNWGNVWVYAWILLWPIMMLFEFLYYVLWAVGICVLLAAGFFVYDWYKRRRQRR